MNKAFTKESESEQEEDFERDVPKLPPGAKHLLTPVGAKRMQDELRELRLKTRPEVTKIVSWAAGNGDRSENGDYTYNKKRLRDIDKRIRFLSKRLESAQVVDPTKIDSDQVLFGATVTIRDEDDRERRYSIVGVDEVEVSKGYISWLSPLGSALLRSREGDVVTFHSPRGQQEIEVMKIEYKSIG